MAQLYVLLIGASVLGILSDFKTDHTLRRYPKMDIYWYLLAAILICFLGLRTRMNDTWAYMGNFNRLIPFLNIDWNIGANPFFVIYQSFIKKYISQSANAFLFISSIFSVSVFLWFLKRHAYSFGYSIFIMFSIGVYGFLGSAIKQTMATAISLIALEIYLSGKKIIPLVLLCAAVLFHPYAIVFIVVPFLNDEIWGKKSLLIIIATIIIGSSFTSFMDNVLKVTDSIGENYLAESFSSGTGTNVIRTLMYAVVPAMSFVYRNEIRSQNDKFMFLAVNLSLVTSCFSVLSMYGGAVSVGRMARYVDIFQCIVLPYIVNKCIKDKSISTFLFAVSAICFLIYYYFYYGNQVETYGFYGDYYQHISFFELLRNWR